MSTPPRILVVDDDEAILDALDAVLQDEGYRTDVSSRDGEYVDDLLQRQLPDLIILDILLSGHDGRDICKKIKSDERTSHIPVVLMSAHIRGEDAARQAGADAFLAKPFDISELLDKIAELL